MCVKVRRVERLHMKGSDPSFEGLVVAHWFRRHYVLKDARVETPQGEWSDPMKGRVMVPKGNVLARQVM